MIFIALKSKSNDINKLLSMYNPCHAGEVLKEYLGDTSISTAAKFWLNMQVNYDLWKASQKSHADVVPLNTALSI